MPDHRLNRAAPLITFPVPTFFRFIQFFTLIRRSQYFYPFNFFAATKPLISDSQLRFVIQDSRDLLNRSFYRIPIIEVLVKIFSSQDDAWRLTNHQTYFGAELILFVSLTLGNTHYFRFVRTVNLILIFLALA